MLLLLGRFAKMSGMAAAEFAKFAVPSRDSFLSGWALSEAGMFWPGSALSCRGGGCIGIYGGMFCPMSIPGCIWGGSDPANYGYICLLACIMACYCWRMFMPALFAYYIMAACYIRRVYCWMSIGCGSCLTSKWPARSGGRLCWAFSSTSLSLISFCCRLKSWLWE